MNNLYGKFGQKDEVQSLQVFSESEMRVYMNFATLNEFHRIDEQFAFYEVNEEKKCFTSFPAIASMITSGGRIDLLRLLESVENPIYCDTDSIHCQNQIDSTLIGEKLGQLKIEFSDKKARYGGKKSYQILGEKSRQKGIPKKSVNDEFFDRLFADGLAVANFDRPLNVEISN